MPRLAKGGKWVFGWVVVSSEGLVVIPPEAVAWYDFGEGQHAMLIRGSQRSGGLGISTEALWPETFGDWHTCARVVGQAEIGPGCTVALPDLGVALGQRLLAVYGSRNALSLLTRGPIYELAETCNELQTFAVAPSVLAQDSISR